jgi:hypothetical protein
MKFSVDAHAIGRHLTGNEVYIRNLLHGFGTLDRDSEFIAYLSVDEPSPCPLPLSRRARFGYPFALWD